MASPPAADDDDYYEPGDFLIWLVFTPLSFAIFGSHGVLATERRPWVWALAATLFMAAHVGLLVLQLVTPRSR